MKETVLQTRGIGICETQFRPPASSYEISQGIRLAGPKHLQIFLSGLLRLQDAAEIGTHQSPGPGHCCLKLPSPPLISLEKATFVPGPDCLRGRIQGTAGSSKFRRRIYSNMINLSFEPQPLSWCVSRCDGSGHADRIH